MTIRLPIALLAFALLSPLSAYADDQAMNPTGGDVARAQFTTAVEDREPMDDVTKLSTAHDKVYFFTELRDLSGHTITHRWTYQGEVMAEVSFDVRGSRWRVWSSKNLQPSWTGEWTVSVVDDNGQVLAEKSLEYTQAAAD